MTKKLKICYVADASNIHVQRWISYAVAQGHDCYCLADKGGAIEGATIIDVPNRDDLLALNEKANKTSVIKARTRKIQQVIEDIRPDILHAIFLYQRGWSAALANFHPLVITLLGSDIFLRESHYRNKLHMLRDQALNQGALQQAELITAVNANLAKEAQKLAGKNIPIDLIPIGTDASLFNPSVQADAVDALRGRLSIEPDQFVILSPRQMAAIYNIDTIIDALPLVLKDIPRAVLILKDAFSNDPERRAYVAGLKQRVVDEGLADHVRWADQVPYEELPLFYHLADVVVSVPTTDGMPVTLFDAMACGTPVIVGDLPSYDEVVTHEVSGLRVPIQDAAALASAIVRIQADLSLAQSMIDNAETVIQRYGIFDEQMARMEARYQELAELGKSTSSKFNEAVYKMLIRVF